MVYEQQELVSDFDEGHDPQYEVEASPSYDPGVQDTLDFDRQSFLGSDW